MTPLTLFLIACGVMLIPVIIVAVWAVDIAKGIDEKDEQRFAERFNEVSDLVKLAEHTPENFDKIRMMIVDLKGMPGRNKEHIQTLQSEFYRQFGQIFLTRWLEKKGWNGKTAKKIAEREMMEM